MLNKETLLELIKFLPNAQDKFIIMAMYYNLGGIGMERLLNLKVKDVDFKNNIIHFSDRDYKMDTCLKKLISNAIKQDVYIRLYPSNNKKDEYPLNIESEYVLRAKPNAKNNNGTTPMSHNGFRSRFKLLTEFLGLQNNSSAIGIVGVAEDIIKNKNLTSINDITVIEVAWEIKANEYCFNPYRVYSKIKERLENQ